MDEDGEDSAPNEDSAPYDDATILRLAESHRAYSLQPLDKPLEEPPEETDEERDLSDIRVDFLLGDRPEDCWRFILAAYELDTDLRTLPDLAAGGLESLLVHHGDQFIERIEARAAADLRFAWMLGGVWQSSMPARIWNRIGLIRERRGWDYIPAPDNFIVPTPTIEKRSRDRPASVLVLGGTGGVGAGIVETQLERGTFARVIVASRDSMKLEALSARHVGDERLRTVVGNVDNDEAAQALLREVQEHGRLAAVVASLGGWWEGPALTELPRDTWNEELRALLTSHFVAAKTFVPALTVLKRSTYLLIGGGAARRPVSGSSLVSIVGAAQLMFARALAAERIDEDEPLIRQLVIDAAIKTHARHHGPERGDEMTAREVGEVVDEMLRSDTTGAWPHVERDGPIVTVFPKAIS